MIDLNKMWTRVTEKYSDDPVQIETLWSEIVISYSNPMRAYHNLEHIQYLMEQAVSHKDEIEDFDAIVMAIMYHDIIYDNNRKDNEDNSAALARFRLGEMSFPSHVIERCIRHIQATQGHLPSDDPDTNFMIDFDLAILGEETGMYQLYREKVRREYWNVTDADFDIGRGKWITALLKRQRIYVTDGYYERYEEKARANLRKELEGM